MNGVSNETQKIFCNSRRAFFATAGNTHGWTGQEMNLGTRCVNIACPCFGFMSFWLSSYILIFVCRVTEGSLEKKNMLSSPAKDKRPNNQQTPLFLIMFQLQRPDCHKTQCCHETEKGIRSLTVVLTWVSGRTWWTGLAPLTNKARLPRRSTLLTVDSTKDRSRTATPSTGRMRR